MEIMPPPRTAAASFYPAYDTGSVIDLTTESNLDTVSTEAAASTVASTSTSTTQVDNAPEGRVSSRTVSRRRPYRRNPEIFQRRFAQLQEEYRLESSRPEYHITEGQTVIVLHGLHLTTEYHATIQSYDATHAVVTYNVGPMQTERVPLCRIKLFNMFEPRQPRRNTNQIDIFSPTNYSPRRRVTQNYVGDEVDFDNMSLEERDARFSDGNKKKHPTLKKRQIRKLPKHKIRQDELNLLCVVCQFNMLEGEEVITLPCKHIYHVECISEWLNKTKANCPQCNRDIVELPII
jgi:hypothetical protein